MLILRSILYKIKTYLSFAKRFFYCPNLPQNRNGKVFIHIGCGEINSPEFINIDIRPFSHIHYIIKDISNLNIFPDNSADLIYACHLAEHLEQTELKHSLLEWKRILKKGGILRLSVPDFDKIVKIYESSNRDINAIAGALLGGQDYKFNFHYNVFNSEKLSGALLDAGFTSTQYWDPFSCDYHAFEDWSSKEITASGKKYQISLNIEAIK